MNKPSKLHVSTGGFPHGMSFCVELVDGELQYASGHPSDAEWNEKIILVTDAQWCEFRKSLDSLNVWSWKEEYENPGVTDGTCWSFEVKYPDKSINSFGDNNYPLSTGLPNNNPDSTPTFEKLLKAVKKLVGGREFY